MPAVRVSRLAILMLFAALLPACEQSTEPLPAQELVSIAPARQDLLSPSDRDRISRDAHILALRDMHRDSLRMVTEIPIDPVLVRLYQNALAHVLLAEHIPASDSVRMTAAFPMPAMHSLILDVNTQAAWVGAWVGGERYTGYKPVDDLLSAWNLNVQSVSRMHSAQSWMVVLESADPLNIQALAEKFRGIEDILYAGPNGLYGDGADIIAERDGSGVTLTYSIGWGDCPSGCIHRHAWMFHVSRIGAVTLRGITGPDLP